MYFLHFSTGSQNHTNLELNMRGGGWGDYKIDKFLDVEDGPEICFKKGQVSQTGFSTRFG